MIMTCEKRIKNVFILEAVSFRSRTFKKWYIEKFSSRWCLAESPTTLLKYTHTI